MKRNAVRVAGGGLALRVEPGARRVSRRLGLGLFGFGALWFAASSCWANRLEVVVTGVDRARGHVRVEVCTRNTFLKRKCPYEGDAPATMGVTVVTIPDVPPGMYAIQAYHDDTDRGVVHQNFLGIPREKIGFSNNARIHWSGPYFNEAAFWVASEVTRVSIRVKHIFGVDG